MDFKETLQPLKDRVIKYSDIYGQQAYIAGIINTADTIILALRKEGLLTFEQARKALRDSGNFKDGL